MIKTLPFFPILLISVFGYGQACESIVQYQDKLEPAAVIDETLVMKVDHTIKITL